MKNILVIGAGAIGRGYLPWIFEEDSRYVFIDNNRWLVENLRERGAFTTHIVRNDQVESRCVDSTSSYHISEFSMDTLREDPDIIFVSVGPRNCLEVLEKVAQLEGPIVLCENDDKLVSLARRSINKPNIYFGVPDVITSNTASETQKNADPLALVTESGTMLIDEGVKKHLPNDFEADIVWCSSSELDTQWLAKLFLHNTPHCIAAYLGARHRCTYVHEAMAIPSVNEVVRGSMHEMLDTLKLLYPKVDSHFLDWYADKEIRRFEQKLLFDPVSRVAREPLRKLERDGRLLRAAEMCVTVGVVPENIITGIVAAILFQNESDPDHHLTMMRESMSLSVFLSYILNLREHEILHQLISQRFDSTQERLRV